jgi:hypothetical protein
VQTEISFEYNDYQEKFKRKNYTKVGEALNSFISLDQSGSFIAKLLRLKRQIDECQKNTVQLFHKSLAFLLVYDDRYLRPEELGDRQVNRKYKFYYPVVDQQQFWSSETDYILLDEAKKSPSMTVDIGFNVLDPDIYSTERFLRGLIPGNGGFFDNLSEGQFKVLVAQYNKRELLVALTFIITHVLLKVHCARMGTFD